MPAHGPASTDAVVQPGTRGSHGATLWRNTDFLKFWAGETLSLYGTQVTTLAAPLTAVLLFDVSPEQLGLLRFAQLVPYLAFGLLFGAWVDRVRRRPIMLAANFARMILIALVPTLAVTGHLRLAPLFAITFCVGVASVMFDVSWMSYVPALVKYPEYLVEANSKLAVTSSSAETAGPGMAGILVSALGAPIAMAVDAFSYLASLISLLLIRTPESAPPAPAGRRHLISELAEGLRWVFANRYLRAMAVVGSFCNFVTMATSSMFILYAVRDRSIGSATLGLILSVGAVGGILGSLISGRVIRRFPLGAIYRVSVALVFIGPVLIPLASGPIPLVAVMFTASFFLIYLGLAVSNVIIMSLRQTVTPRSLMGRMNAAMRTLMFGGGSIGGPAAGLLAGAIGLHGALWIVAIGSAAILVPIALSPIGRLREMPPAATPDSLPLAPPDESPHAIPPAAPPATGRDSPAGIASAVAALLARRGMTRIYTAASPAIAVISVTAGLTAWTNGRQLWWAADGNPGSWPAADPEGAAARLAALAGGPQPPPSQQPLTSRPSVSWRDHQSRLPASQKIPAWAAEATRAPAAGVTVPLSGAPCGSPECLICRTIPVPARPDPGWVGPIRLIVEH